MTERSEAQPEAATKICGVTLATLVFKMTKIDGMQVSPNREHLFLGAKSQQ